MFEKELSSILLKHQHGGLIFAEQYSHNRYDVTWK